ncbi:hypothetical protein DFH06DRAFT_187356 [Mycena polygramma]|nr:hypothetical protein DFH06DRAFT_187356 [Mycena polygramma]
MFLVGLGAEAVCVRACSVEAVEASSLRTTPELSWGPVCASGARGNSAPSHPSPMPSTSASGRARRRRGRHACSIKSRRRCALRTTPLHSCKWRALERFKFIYPLSHLRSASFTPCPASATPRRIRHAPPDQHAPASQPRQVRAGGVARGSFCTQRACSVQERNVKPRRSERRPRTPRLTKLVQVALATLVLLQVLCARLQRPRARIGGAARSSFCVRLAPLQGGRGSRAGRGGGMLLECVHAAVRGRGVHEARVVLHVFGEGAQVKAEAAAACMCRWRARERLSISSFPIPSISTSASAAESGSTTKSAHQGHDTGSPARFGHRSWTRTCSVKKGVKEVPLSK